MAQTRKQLSNKLTQANAIIEANDGMPRKTLNARVKAAESKVAELSVALQACNIAAANATNTYNNDMKKLEARIAELETQVTGEGA